MQAQINVHFAAQNFEELLQIAQTCIKLFPTITLGFKAAGVALFSLNQKRQAILFMEKAVLLDARDSEALSNLGYCLNECAQNQAELLKAQQFLKRALNLNSQSFVVLNNLAGNALYLKKFKDAEEYAQKSLKLNQNYLSAYLNLASAFLAQNSLEKGEIILNELKFKLNLMNKDEKIKFYYLKMNISHLKGEKIKAYEAAKECVLLDEKNIKNKCFFNVFSNEIGKSDESASRMLELFKENKNEFELLMRLPSVLIYSSKMTPEKIGKVLNEIKQILSKKIKTKYKHFPPKEKLKKLKIGFVSGDLKKHAVSFFIFGLLKHLNKEQFNFYAYLSFEQKDNTQEVIQPLFYSWKNIENCSDEEASKIIQNDGIHILFDLSGHTLHNRLGIFALKPAPVQISWMGFLGSTAMPNMDYFLADSFIIQKEETKKQFTEKVYLLPDVWECYTPPFDLKKQNIKNAPLLKNNYLTFGSFANPNKVNEKTIELWAKILNKIPESHLFYLRTNFKENALKEEYIQRFLNYGISQNRIEIVGIDNLEEYKNSFEKVDIILDSFPVGGMTTTCESLLMGLPTLCLAGDLMASRLSALCMHVLNLDEWIAHDENEFVEKAVCFNSYFKNNPQQLNELRFSLRNKMLNSPLCDNVLFAQNFEKMLWDVWNEFLNQNQYKKNKKSTVNGKKF